MVLNAINLPDSVATFYFRSNPGLTDTFIHNRMLGHSMVNYLVLIQKRFFQGMWILVSK